jgi:hypothetical protein
MENIVINFDADTTGLTKAIDLLVKMGLVTKKDAEEFAKLNATTNQFAQGQNVVQKELSETEKLLSQIALQGQKTNAILSDSGNKTGAGFKKAKSDIGALDGILTKVGGAIAGVFAVQKIVAFGEASIKAFQEAEKNALLLKSAVSVNGGLQQDFEELIRQSEELQKVTIFSDDAIQQAQTAALQFGLTKDQVQALIPVVADFASATGQTLQSALDGVLQGVNGMGRGLKIYGVTIDETQSKTDRLGDITDQLNKKFLDQAEAVGKTASGAAAKYANQIDDLQEVLGERLSPKLQGLKSFFLDLGEAALTASDDFGKFMDGLGNFINGRAINFSVKVDTNVQDIVDANKAMVESFKKSFQSLSTKELDDKLDFTIRMFNEKTEIIKTSSGIEQSLARKSSVEYANQAAALRELLKLRESGVDSIDAQTAALNKLKDIASLSNDDLLKIKKTLESFNDINLSDEIDLIEKTIEARKKAGDKQLADQQKNLETLHALEQAASDNLLKVKAAEIDKVAELELQKQQEIKKIQDAFVKSGEPIIESAKTKQAIKEITDAFNILIAKEKEAQAEIDIKIHLETIDKKFADFQKVITDLQAGKEIEIKTKFIQQGDFSDEAFKKMQAEMEALSEETFNDLLKGAKAYGVSKAVIDDMVLKHNQENADKLVKTGKDAYDQDIENARKAAEEKEKIQQAFINASQEIISQVADLTNSFYEQDIERIDRQLQLTLASYDEQAAANEELHNKNMRGDRQYEAAKKKIDAERLAAEKKADKEKRKIIHDQAVFNKSIAIANAVINTAVAVTANLAIPVVAALVAVLGAIEVALIAAEPIPGYAKGKERITGKGTETSDDVPVRLSVGERIVKASTNRKYFPILSAIHHERFDPEAMNNLSKMNPETIRMISKTDPLLIRELATMQPVFLKHINHPSPTMFRTDILPQMQQTYNAKFVSHETLQAQPPGLDEYDIGRALDRGTRIKNVGELAKEVGKQVSKELKNPYDIYRR